MAHFASLWKARIIEKCRLDYENEKINSLLLSNTEIPTRTLSQKWRNYSQEKKKRLTDRLKKWVLLASPISKLYFGLKTDQSFPNFVLKSIIGFFGGIVLTYLCFMFFVFQLSISLMHATIMSSIIGVLLTLGLAFSYRIRCLVFLLIPQFFSRVGRYTLTCYALVLILTGPATNTLKNSEVLSESMACSQEQIKTSVRLITESMKKPYNFMKDSTIYKGMKEVTHKMNEITSAISRLVTSIGDVIQSSLSWINSVVDTCNFKFGTPYERCRKLLHEGVSNCKKTLSANMTWLCNAPVAHFCDSVRSYKSICQVADYATGSFAATIRRKLRLFTSRIRSMFFVNIKVHHTYSFSSNGSQSAGQVAAGIVTEIRNRADPLLTWLSWTSCVTSLFLLLIIFRAKYYQQMFETRSRFDNRYVTKELLELDFKRFQEGRETVLPLHRREQAKYIITASLRLVASERVYLWRSVVFMAITTFKLLIHMTADFSLYWVLMTIRYHGRFQSPLPPGPSDAGIQIYGTGLVADLVRSLFDSLTTPLRSPTPSPITCLPNPYPPDLQRYSQIAILIVLLWICALFEPYGLRLRHVIMGHYRPERAKTRAVWLYNHILRTRGSFMKLARRKLHREYKYSSEERLTFRHWLNSHVPCWFLRYIFCTLPKPHCLLCNTAEEYNDLDTALVSCETRKCPGVYCRSCYSDIGQLCTICLSPDDYGDMSDVSLERGSSSEDSNSESDAENCQDHDNMGSHKINKIEKTQLLKKSCSNKELISRQRSEFKSSNGNKYNAISDTHIEYSIDNKDWRCNRIMVIHRGHCISNGVNKISVIKTSLLVKNFCNNLQNDIKYDVPNSRITTTFAYIIIIDDICNYKMKAKKSVLMRKRKHIHSLKVPIEKIVLLQTLKNCHSKILVPFISNLNIHCKRKKPLKFVRRTLWYEPNYYKITASITSMSISKIVHVTKSRKKLNKTNTNQKYKSSKNGDRTNEASDGIIHKTTLNNDNNNRHQIASGRNFYNNSHIANPKFNKNDEKFKKSNKKSARNKNVPKTNKSGHKFKKLCSLYSSCCTGTFENNGLQIDEDRTYPYLNDKTNYKRRKKDEDLQLNNASNGIVRKNQTHTRNYRLSSYLLNQCWGSEIFKKKKKKRCAVNDLVQLRLDAAEQRDKEMDILEIIKATFSSEKSKCCCPFNVCVCEKAIKLKKKKKKAGKKKGIRACFFGKCCKYKHKPQTSVNHIRRPHKQKDLCSQDSEDNISDEVAYNDMTKHDSIDKGEFNHVIFGDTRKQDSESSSSSNQVNTLDTKPNNQGNKKIHYKGLKTPMKTIRIKDITLAISERFIDLRLRNPFPKMKDIYALFVDPVNKTKKHTKQMKTEDKEVTVLPVVETCSCQLDEFKTLEDHTTQYPIKRQKHKAQDYLIKLVPDGETDDKETCTCATQYTPRNKDQSCEVNASYSKELGNDDADINDEYDDASSSVLSPVSDGTRTDTTICSRVTVNDDTDEAPKVIRVKKPRIKVKVITKSNRGTVTDRAKLCDVSTITSDWWSPIVERKESKFHVDRGDNGQRRRHKSKHDRSISTDGRIVQFKSQAQIIPPDTCDVLSPARYLLESQKYYNELFSPKYYSPHVFPAIQQSSKLINKTHSDESPKRINRARPKKRPNKCR